MKNLTIGTKLTAGFGIIILLLLLTILISVESIQAVEQQMDNFGIYTVPNTEQILNMKRDMASIQRYLLEAYVHENDASIQASLAKADADAQHLRDMLDDFASTQRNNSQEKMIQDIKAFLDDATSSRKAYEQLVIANTAESLSSAQRVFWDEYAPKHIQIDGILDQISDSVHSNTENQWATGKSAISSGWTLLAVSAAVSLLLAIVIVVLIRRSIMNPVKEIEGVYREMAKGNMQASISYDSRDELGSMAKSIQATNAMLAAYIRDITEKLSQLSRGDMRVNVELDYIGDFSSIKQAMENTAHALNHTLKTINIAAEQVSTGASQVASGAQALAAGSTEQASSVEQLSSSIVKIAEQAEENSANVKDATRYVEQAVANVQNGSGHMKQLTEAKANIGAASDQITNITKVIEDIAFQTNILALNAAIEAARAGNAGKGFAVVADEVRNLAAKSAEAAKKTAELIQRSAATVTEGTQVAAQTAVILKVKQGLNQVSSVVQTNAATAEENSATSEEMSAQAATLREEVGKFLLDTEYDKEILFAGLHQNGKKELIHLSSRTGAPFGKY